MFDTVLIANRGAIANRIIRTLKKMGIASVAVYHEADARSLHVRNADTSICLGGGSAADTYLDIDKILDAAKQTGAQAIHPGYGFLSENTEFVKRCEAEGIAFIGPTCEQISLFGLKHQAREAAEQAGVPLVPGSPLLESLDSACDWAAQVNYPVMLKSTAGGGGIGMQVCHDEAQLRAGWDKVRRLGTSYFSDDGVFLEKYIADARHIEVQIFGDGAGTAVSLGERDCSAQRRNQKVLEETPAPGLTDTVRNDLHRTAERLMASVNYRNAGTVEFIYDAQQDAFYFLEVNTRLQVEHGVTEQVWGVDLVGWMLRQGAGELYDLTALKAALAPTGHAVQARIYAEDPLNDFRPSAGLLSCVQWPAERAGLRVDHWVESGIEVPALFDPMLAKVIVHQPTRQQALTGLSQALEESTLYGIETNANYVRALIHSEACRSGQLLTRTLADFHYRARQFYVLQPGTQTTVQDYPGRQGYWDIGVPPSGPMDSLNFRLANQLLGNPPEAPALEMTLNGPTLKFTASARIALTGAPMAATLDGQPVAFFRPIDVRAGQVLKVGRVTGAGARAYFAIGGGIDCPPYLGSCATFTLGQFGGHAGRALRTGDVCHYGDSQPSPAQPLPEEQRPELTDTWQLRVIYGPHGAPDFFTDDDIKTFFSTDWEVHYNSSRTGIRLVGPKPQWARETGGEAGLHPSNIHDNAYALGTVDFTGDMPVILGPDGPSLGGFVCPATVIQADLWKLGQLKAGDRIRFVSVAPADAVKAERQQLAQLQTLDAREVPLPTAPLNSPVVKRSTLLGENVNYRVAGDHFLLVELGPIELDIARRFKVHALMLWLQDNRLPGMRELTPGIRSLQVHYDSQQLSLEALIEQVETGIATLKNADDLTVPTRVVHLPLSWDDQACRDAIAKYTQSVRPGAPWCPSNIEFIRRINGLASVDQVKDIVFNASYLVMGLGDVYLGAPVATPVDPRHRLVTTKYNPARTWTAENSVGIGGAYMCVYGMEGPGGYQFVGRTLQMWNRYRRTREFDKPWLLRFFDQIRFYPVSQDELKQIRADFPLGDYPLRIEEQAFSLEQYQAFLDDNAPSISAFAQKRHAAFEDELAQWRRDGQLTYDPGEAAASAEQQDVAPDHVQTVDSPVSGNLWQLSCKAGQKVQAGETLMVLESMKMEIEVPAPEDGYVHRVLAQEASAVTAGQVLVWLSPEPPQENTNTPARGH